jgi:predicted transcriptional regulator
MFKLRCNGQMCRFQDEITTCFKTVKSSKIYRYILNVVYNNDMYSNQEWYGQKKIAWHFSNAEINIPSKIADISFGAARSLFR